MQHHIYLTLSKRLQCYMLMIRTRIPYFYIWKEIQIFNAYLQDRKIRLKYIQFTYSLKKKMLHFIVKPKQIKRYNFYLLFDEAVHCSLIQNLVIYFVVPSSLLQSMVFAKLWKNVQAQISLFGRSKIKHNEWTTF